MFSRFAGKHIVLLQGPAGPFFRRFAEELRGYGAHVTKINFHAGDVFFFNGPESIPYTGTLAGFAEFFRNLCQTQSTQAIFLFGDCRPYHQAAKQVAKTLGIEVYVFEEGYLRPDYITLEFGGVNVHSSMPRDPRAYYEKKLPKPKDPEPVGHTFGYAAIYTILNALNATLYAKRFPHYRHHRDLNAFRQTGYWVKSGLRKKYFEWREAHLIEQICGEWSKRYFFVPLQVHLDYQIKNSRFSGVEEFIREVVASFARGASPQDRLILKHHPDDRPYRDYGALVSELAKFHALEGRLIYVHDLHLPTLLRHARGTVLINSTVGLSSLHHRTPVLALDKAVYCFMGLTKEMPLDEFWKAPPEVDYKAYLNARAWLVHYNQANGNFYKRVSRSAGPTGVVWPAGFWQGKQRFDQTREALGPQPETAAEPAPILDKSLAAE